MYSHESTDMLICDLLDSLEARSTHGAHAFALIEHMASLCSYKITCTHPLRGQLFHLSGAHFISSGFKFKSSHHLGADYKSQDPSLFPSHHWISVVLHGPSFHPATALDPGE